MEKKEERFLGWSSWCRRRIRRKSSDATETMSSLLGTKEGIDRLGHVIHVVGVKFDHDGDGARDA